MLRDNYVTLVWIVSQILHPFIWMINGDNIFEIFNVAGFFLLTLFFSLPAFFIGIVSFSRIANLKLKVIKRFILFLFVIETSIFLTDFIFSLFFFELEFFIYMLLLSIPAAISSVLAIVFTLPIFIKRVQNIDDYEYTKQDM